MNLPTIVGLGEILWDFLPSGRQLGGAPANFAYCSHLLGNRAVVASRIGTDDLGSDIRKSLSQLGLAESFLQVDSSYPTGTVHVELDSRGQPKYEITHSVAWDFMEWTDTWEGLAKSCAAVCFGSLAQRSGQSCSTISNFLSATRKDTLRVFDVNLRQQFYSADVIEQSFHLANVVKLNHEELQVLKNLLGFGESILDAAAFARLLISRFDLQLVCVTYGAEGSFLCDRFSSFRHPGFRVSVNDTVGSGDAFTAGLVHCLLSGQPLAEVNDLANRMGAWVASCAGGMPPPPEGGLMQELLRI